MDYENDLKKLADCVKKLKSKIFALTRLNEKIKEHDFFTSEERSSIHEMLEKLKYNLSVSEQSFTRKNDLYYNHVLQLKSTLENRQKIINECIGNGQDFDIDDICEVFVETQGTLTEQLKKSETMLEQQ